SEPGFNVLPSISQLAVVDAMTDGTLTYPGIFDTAANLIAGGTYLNGSVGFTVDGSATVAQIATLSGMTTGPKAYMIEDTYANLDAANSAHLNGANYIFVSDAVTVDQALAFKGEYGAVDIEFEEVADTAANILAA